MNIRVGIVAVISAFFTIVFVFLFIFGVSLFSVQSIERNSPVNNIEGKPYQLLEINLNDNEDSEFQNYDYSLGMMTSFKNLPEEGYLSTYDLKKGKVSLVSEFGHSEYECTGKCFCNDNHRRALSATSNLLSKSAVVLVAALSSSVALNYAKNQLESLCEHRFTDECESGQVSSELEECQSVYMTASTNEEETTKEGPGVYDGLADLPDDKKWWCRGRCGITNPKVKMIEMGLEEWYYKKSKGKKFSSLPKWEQKKLQNELSRSRLERKRCIRFEIERQVGYSFAEFRSKDLKPFCGSFDCSPEMVFCRRVDNLKKNLEKKEMLKKFGMRYDEFFSYPKEREAGDFWDPED